MKSQANVALCLLVATLMVCGRSAAGENQTLTMRAAVLDDCIFRPTKKDKNSGVDTVGTILGGAASALVIKGIDTLATYLSSAVPYTYSAQTRIDAFAKFDGKSVTRADDASCLIVVVAPSKDFQAMPFNGLKGTANDSTSLKDWVKTRYADRGTKMGDSDIPDKMFKSFGLTGQPQFYFEGTLGTDGSDTNNATVAFVDPKFWYYPAFLGESSWRYGSKRDVLFVIQFFTAGAADKAFGEYRLTWEGVTAGGITAGTVENQKGPAFPLPAAELAVPHGMAEGYYFPINVTVTLTETAKPYQLLAALGQEAKDQEKPIADAVKQEVTTRVSPEAASAAKTALLDDAKAKSQKYTDAYQEMAKAKAAMASASGSDKKRYENDVATDKAYVKQTLEDAQAARKSAQMEPLIQLDSN